MRLIQRKRNLLDRFLSWWLERREDDIRRFDQAPMADGVVKITNVDSLRGTPLTIDPRFRRFEPPLEGQAPLNEARRYCTFKEPPLLGRIVIGSIFLGLDGQTWTDREQAEALASLLRAAEWIERQAMTWQARVNIQLLDVVFLGRDDLPRPPTEIEITDEGDGQGMFERDAEVRLVASLSRAMSEHGFHDLGDFMDRVVPQISADELVWIVHVRAAGRSFVVPEREVGIHGVSLAVCYAREQEFPGKLIGKAQPDAVTIAHEVLHLFGASDKYGVPLSSFARGSVTRDDVMRLDHERLSRLRVNPLTASELGWPERKPPASTC